MEKGLPRALSLNNECVLVVDIPQAAGINALLCGHQTAAKQHESEWTVQYLGVRKGKKKKKKIKLANKKLQNPTAFKTKKVELLFCIRK